MYHYIIVSLHGFVATLENQDFVVSFYHLILTSFNGEYTSACYLIHNSIAYRIASHLHIEHTHLYMYTYEEYHHRLSFVLYHTHYSHKLSYRSKPEQFHPLWRDEMF